MAAVYDRLGVRFVYPENWKLQEDEAIEWPRSVSVESPLGAFWTAMIHAAGTDLKEALAETLEALKSEYDQVEFERADEEFAERRAEGFDLQFFYLDLLITARVRGLHVGDQVIVVISQGEDRDFEALKEVFRAMTESLVRCDLPSG